MISVRDALVAECDSWTLSPALGRLAEHGIASNSKLVHTATVQGFLLTTVIGSIPPIQRLCQGLGPITAIEIGRPLEEASNERLIAVNAEGRAFLFPPFKEEQWGPDTSPTWQPEFEWSVPLNATCLHVTDTNHDGTQKLLLGFHDGEVRVIRLRIGEEGLESDTVLKVTLTSQIWTISSHPNIQDVWISVGHSIVKLNTSTGVKSEVTKTGDLKSCLVRDSEIVLFSPNGDVVAIHPQSFDTRWSSRLQGTLMFGRVFPSGDILIASWEGMIFIILDSTKGLCPEIYCIDVGTSILGIEAVSSSPKASTQKTYSLAVATIQSKILYLSDILIPVSESLK